MSNGEQITLYGDESSLARGMSRSGPPKDRRIPQGLSRGNEFLPYGTLFYRRYSTWGRRDYTYIDDIIDGVMAAIDYTDSMYEIINLGNNRTVQLLELVEAIEEASGIEADKTHAPEVPGDVEQTWADVSKAKELLEYSPGYNLKEGLKNFVKWYNKYQKLAYQLT